jgi:hypothetical protein
VTTGQHCCICCNCPALDQPAPGSYATCDVCGWQDRALDTPHDRYALERSQVSVAATGLAVLVSSSDVRAPSDEEILIMKSSSAPLALERKRTRQGEAEALIRKAFRNVRPDGRVPLRRAFEADLGGPGPTDWDDSDQHWWEVPNDAIRAYAAYGGTVFIFGNAATFRYYIAPFMIYGLHEDSSGAIAALNSGDIKPGGKSRNADHLDSAQREAVMSFLSFEQIYGDFTAQAEKVAVRWGQESAPEIL